MSGEGPEPYGTSSILSEVLPSIAAIDDNRGRQPQTEIEPTHELSARDRENPAEGPMQERRTAGVATPERPVDSTRTENTPGQQGIEIDHEKDRPQDKQS